MLLTYCTVSRPIRLAAIISILSNQKKFHPLFALFFKLGIKTLEALKVAAGCPRMNLLPGQIIDCLNDWPPSFVSHDFVDTRLLRIEKIDQLETFRCNR